MTENLFLHISEGVYLNKANLNIRIKKLNEQDKKKQTNKRKNSQTDNSLMTTKGAGGRSGERG